MNAFGVSMSLSLHHRNPSNVAGLCGIMSASWLSGPDGKQICEPIGRVKPSVSVRGVLTTRWKDTIVRVVLAFASSAVGRHTLSRRIKPLRLPQKTIQFPQSLKLFPRALLPPLIQCLLHFLPNRTQKLRPQNQVIQRMRQCHRTRMHDRKTHLNQHILRQQLGLAISLVIC